MSSYRRAIFACSAALAAAAVMGLAPSAGAKVKASVDGSLLLIEGGDGKDRVVVRCANGNVKVNGKNPKGGAVPCSQIVELNTSTGGSRDVVDYSAVGPEFGEAKFGGFGTGTGVAALLGAGNDRYISSATAFNLAFGGPGRDRGNGGRAKDILSGGGDADVLNGAAGGDSVLGNAGDDRLNGGPGADVVSGHAGDDLLLGGPGADAIGGGTGMDRLRGGAGPDRLFGGAGKDKLSGGAGKDEEKQDRALRL
jgi:Ca2+-binding RTX toxin-like protein